MNEQMYIVLHQAADRLALEASRNVTEGKEAECYNEKYAEVLKHLISEYESHDIKD